MPSDAGTQPSPAPEDLDWSPARSGGAIFATHRGRFEPERAVFSPARGPHVLLGVIGCAGVITTIGGVGSYLRDHDGGALVVAAVMAVMSLVLIVILRRLLLNHRVFDRRLDRYWDTRDGGTLTQPGPQALPLAEIRGIQITRERVVGGDADYDADELNLVLRTANANGRTRVNVVDYADSLALREDAEQLAAWLGVPLWINPQITTPKPK